MSRGNLSVGMALGVVLGALVVLVVAGLLAVRLLDLDGKQWARIESDGLQRAEVEPVVGMGVRWWFDGTDWRVEGDPPECTEPLRFPAPVDVSLASGILYPGQVRGGEYKPHGGFRFDGLADNRVEVFAPMDGELVRAAGYLQAGEVQYSLVFIAKCGVMYKLDHLRQLTEKFEKVMEEVPRGGEGDSRTIEIRPAVFAERGEVIATEVGFEKDLNVFVDFGVYDLRKVNGVVYSEEFRAQHPNLDEQGTHGLCWLDYLDEADASVVEGLPAGGIEGKVSDYCK